MKKQVYIFHVFDGMVRMDCEITSSS